MKLNWKLWVGGLVVLWIGATSLLAALPAGDPQSWRSVAVGLALLALSVGVFLRRPYALVLGVALCLYFAAALLMTIVFSFLAVPYAFGGWCLYRVLWERSRINPNKPMLSQG
jgi:hypothetical protein